ASLEEHNRNVAKWRVVEREMRAREAEEAAAQAAAQAAAAADGGSAVADAAAAQNAATSPGAIGTQPKVAGAAVAKGTSSAMAADPDALNGGQNPFSPEGVPDDEAPPKPLRNPKR